MTADSIESRFEWVRLKAVRRLLVVVPRVGDCLLLPALEASSVKPEMLAVVEAMIPPADPRKVAVIGNTTLPANVPPSIQAFNQAIPFFGMLMGFTYIGHAVWVFDGSVTQFSPGCRDADVLMVDSALIPMLSENWLSEARKVMRGRQVLVHDRATYKLLMLA
jgi:hypothetical protein